MEAVAGRLIADPYLIERDVDDNGVPAGFVYDDLVEKGLPHKHTGFACPYNTVETLQRLSSALRRLGSRCFYLRKRTHYLPSVYDLAVVSPRWRISSIHLSSEIFRAVHPDRCPVISFICSAQPIDSRKPLFGTGFRLRAEKPTSESSVWPRPRVRPAQKVKVGGLLQIWL